MIAGMPVMVYFVTLSRGRGLKRHRRQVDVQGGVALSRRRGLKHDRGHAGDGVLRRPLTRAWIETGARASMPWSVGRPLTRAWIETGFGPHRGEESIVALSRGRGLKPANAHS